jgi:bifunctional non-homologous end joining protein LigD
MSLNKPKRFVIQEHLATNKHWDLRLQNDGEMYSWAIPKGPSLNPSIKRLAVETPEHSLEYSKFEGVIAKGLYGAGKVLQWDKGTYKIIEGSVKSGFLKFSVKGKKLKGNFAMIKTKRGWILVKERDEYASKKDVVKAEPRSVKSGKTIREISKEDGYISEEKKLGF